MSQSRKSPIHWTPLFVSQRQRFVELIPTLMAGWELNRPLVMGHETIGIVEEVGPGVTHPKQGNRVVITAFISCGHCDNCARAMASLCTIVDPPNGGAAFGIGSVGSQNPREQGTSTELLLKITCEVGHLR